MRPNFVRTPLASRRIAYEGDPVRTLLIDNYDSYTYNLWQLLAEVNGVEPQVVLNDAFGGSWTRCAKNSPPFDNIVISPGPGRPDYKEDFGMCADAILHADVPLLGVCLGHQGISSAFGGKVVRGRKPMHGRLSALVHDGSGLFRNLPIETKVVRYHSLTVERSSLPSVLRPIAWTVDGEIMGLEHTSKAMFGVQFHPESVCTVAGRQILSNFRDITLQKMGAARVVQDPTGCAVASTSMKYNKLPIDSRGLAFEADRPTHRANTISFGSAEHKLSAPNSNSGAAKDIAGAHDNFVRENESVRVVDRVRELSRKKFVHVISVFPPPNSPKTAAVTTEQVFEQLYGGQAASFWLDSACPGPVQLDCPTSDGLDCSAGAGALHTDKARSGGPGASTEADETTKRCIHGEPGETTERANAGQKERFSYMGAVDTEAACAVEYSGDRQLFLRSPLSPHQFLPPTAAGPLSTPECSDSPLSPHQPCRRVNQSILEYLRDQLQLEEETETLVLHTNIDQLDSSTPISGSTAATSLNMSDWKVLSSLSSFKFTASGAFFGYLGYELGVETTQILAAAASKPTSAPYKASPTTSVSPTLGKVRNGETTAAGIEGFEGAASSSSSSSSSSLSSSSSSRRGPFYDLSALRGAGWDRDLVPPQLQPHRATAGTAGTEAEAKEVVGGHAVLTPGDRVRNKQWGRKSLSEQPMAVLLRPSRYVVYDHSRDVYHVVSVALEEGAEIGRDEGADTKQIAEACEAAEPSRAARGAVEVGQDLAQRLIAVLGGKLLQPQCSFPVDKDTADASGGAPNLSLETPTQSQSPLNDLTPLQQEEASPRPCAPTPAPAPAPAPTALLMACKSPAPAPAPAPTALLMACKSRAAYRRDIASCLEYIGEGESYEVCLTLQFRGRRSDPSQAPLRTYQALRRRNPAPYACYLRYDPVALMLPQQQPQQQPQQPASSEAADGSSNGQANTTAAGLEWYTHGGITVCSTSPECFLHISQVLTSCNNWLC